MATSSTTGQTDFTGIVNAIQMLTQMVGQNNKTINAIAALLAELPTPSPANALDMIRINAGGTAYEVRTPTQVISDLGINNTAPVGASNQTTGTAISVTTPSFTAPATGALVIFADGTAQAAPTSASLTTSLGGLVTLFTAFGGISSFGCGYLPMVATNSSTVTFSVTTGSSVAQTVTILAFFLPQA